MKQSKLKDLFDYLPKSKIKAGEGLKEGKYPFYTSSENQSKFLNDFQHAPGCLIFGTGGKASVHFSAKNFSISTDCITIKPKPIAKIEAEYVFHYFKGNMRVLEKGFKGAGLKHISKAYLSDIQIPCFKNTDDQKRIVYLLGKVEKLINQRKQSIQQLDDLLQSVFFDMFGDPVRNEKSWERPVLSLFGNISTGNTPPRKDPYNYSSNFLEWIKTDNISSDKMVVSTANEYLSESGTNKGRTVKKGSLLVACIAGSIESIGRAALTDRRVAFNQQINAIQPFEDVHPLYLYVLFKISKSYIQSCASKGMKNIITKRDFEKIKLIKPPFAIQKQFASIVEKIETIKSQYQHSLKDLEYLYGALSQKAFKGELDLSKVPLPDEIKGVFDNVISDEPVKTSVNKPDNSILGFSQFDAAIFNNNESRKTQLSKWFHEWLKQYEKESDLNINHFWQCIHFTAQDYLDENDNPLEINLSDYDHIKSEIFVAIKRGYIEQTINTIKVNDETGNQILLKKVTKRIHG